MTEGRFRKHVKAIKDEDIREMIHLDDMLLFITQDDVVHRRMFDPNHRSHVPDFGCYIKAEVGGKLKYFALSRQLVLFAVERRKAWRVLQSKSGLVNKDYLAQKALLAKLDKGELRLNELQARTRELFDAGTRQAGLEPAWDFKFIPGRKRASAGRIWTPRENRRA